MSKRKLQHKMSVQGALTRRYGLDQEGRKVLLKLAYKGLVTIARDGTITMLKTGPWTIDLVGVLRAGNYVASITLERVREGEKSAD